MQSEWRERLGRQVNDKLTEGSHQRERNRERERERERRGEEKERWITEGVERSGAEVENGGRLFQLQQLV